MTMTFETEFSVALYPYLDDFRSAEGANVPASALIELGLAVARHLIASGPVALHAVESGAPIVIAEGATVAVRVSVLDEGVEHRIRVESAAGTHFTCRVARAPAESAVHRTALRRLVEVAPRDAAAASDYNVHPTLIQSALAMFGGDAGPRDCRRVAKVTLFAPAGASASVALARADGSLAIHTSTGSVALRLEGVELATAPAAMPAPAPASSEEDVRAFVVARTAQLVGVAEPDLDADVPLLELGLDSISGMDLLTSVRTRFGVRLDVAKLMEGVSTNDVVALVRAAVGVGVGVGAGAAAPHVPAPEESAVVLNATPRRVVVRRDPLTSTQLGFYLEEQVDEGSSVNNIAVELRASGDLDLDAFERAVNVVVARHEALRTTFTTVDDTPWAEIAAEGAVRLASHDLSALAEAERAAELARRMTAEAQRPFDLEVGPLLRMTAFKVAAREHRVACVIHHIVSDGWSLGVFMRELAAAYTAYRGASGIARARTEPALAPVAMQFADLARVQETWLETDEAARQLDYWKKALAGAPELIELPTDRARPPVRSSRGSLVPVALGRETTATLKTLFKKHGVTQFVGTLAIFQTLLHRYARQEQVVTGSAMAGRSIDDSEGVIGACLNMLAMHTDFSGDPTFAELLKRVRSVAQGAFANHRLPFDRVAAAVSSARDSSYTPVFQTAFAYQNSPIDLRLPDVTLGVRALDPGGTHADVQLMLSDGPDGITGTLGFSTDLFDASTAERMAGHLVALAAAAAKDAETRVSKLAMMDAAEVARVLRACNPVDARPVDPRCLHEVFEAQARLRPNALAVTFDGDHMTYAELDRRANQLAHFLAAEGVGPETRVAICLERGFEMIVAVLGVLKSGGAYVPIDPIYPKDRATHMIEDTQAPVVLTQASLRGQLPDAGGRLARVVCLDTEWSAIGDLPAHAPAPSSPVTNANAAYVIYTSGSTGKPKGCVIEHRMVTPLFAEMQPCIGFDHDDVWTMFHSLAFDFSVWEIWGALLHGGRLVVVPFLVSRSPEEFHALLVEEGVTILNQTPSAFRQLDQADEASGRSGDLKLRRVMMGGEAVETKMLRSWWERHAEDAPQLVTVYGITETTVLSTFKLLTRAELTSQARCPIGGSIPGWKHYVLDANRSPVPVGLVGELYIGGGGVGRGYLNRDELTRERFLPDPFSSAPGARMYKSSDLVRLLPDGTFDFLGRADTQVKIRGFRIELGEIETAIGRHPAVRNAFVVARKTDAGDDQLVAYVVAIADAKPTVNELRASIQDKLPAYMVPAHVIFLDALPLTSNGKVDRKALPAPTETSGVVRTVAPARDDLEQSLVALWEELVRIKPIGIHDDFFEIGGSSLVAMQMFLRIKKAHGKSLPIATLFNKPTIAALAEALRGDAITGGAEKRSALVEIQRGAARIRPIFFVHPSGGDVFAYRELARALGKEQPFYGIRTPSLEDRGRRCTDLALLAREYVALVREKQPRGPYLVGGWSMGGVVALEMTRQLEAAGEEVEHALLLDTNLAILGGSATFERAELVRLFLVDLIGLIGADASTFGAGFWSSPPEAQLETLLAAGKHSGLFPPELGASDLEHRVEVFVDNLAMMRSYALAPLRASVLLVAAERSTNEGSAAVYEDARATVDLQVSVVPGDHYSVTRAPHVERVAREMMRAIHTFEEKLSLAG